jgi:hypothetical protein
MGKDQLLGWGGTDDLAEPAEGGRAPGGLASVPDILPQEQRLQPKLRGLESAAGIFARPAQGPQGCILHLGPGDRGEVPRAPQASAFDRIPAGGCAPLPGLLGEQGGRDAPAALAFFRQRAVAPLPARAGFRDKDAMLTLRLQRPAELIAVPLAGPNGAEGDDLSVGFFGDLGDRHRVFMDIQTDVEGARRGHG